ncbi:hypothetical protein V3I05_04985 [Helicobacter mastomyrinus]|uniref:Uncharacterized protein n=1 Tax=Helicobacter mastomyrinus TaxID=287948 RepID=A0ABZ3F923_9HELI|nr:hypothetical protein [uncultured Helicobacter sp.]
MRKVISVLLAVAVCGTFANAFDIKDKALGAASDLASGKSVKDITEDTKKEVKNAANAEVEKQKAELEKQKQKAMKKADEKTGGAASIAGELLKK